MTDKTSEKGRAVCINGHVREVEFVEAGPYTGKDVNGNVLSAEMTYTVAPRVCPECGGKWKHFKEKAHRKKKEKQ